MWRYDHTAGNLVGDHAAKALADDVQAAVKRGSSTRRGDDIAVIDVERIDIQLYVREKRLKLMFKFPVRGRAFTVENARITQHKRPQTKPDDLRPVVSGLDQAVEKRLGRALLDMLPVRHDDDICLADGGEIVSRVKRKPVCGCQ